MPRKYQRRTESGYTVLVVDDSPDILESTRRLLEADGHRVLTAPDGRSALAQMEQERVHLMLVDYFMPGMTGEELVHEVRRTDSLVQMILVTGYAGEKPARTMMRQLDIQGYHDKSEGAERLLLWVDAALKAYRHVLAMEKHRLGLRFVLDVTPELHRIQPLEELLQGILWHMEGLLGAENSFLATYEPGARRRLPEGAEGFVAVADEGTFRDESLAIRFGTGRFRRGTLLEHLPEPDRATVSEALRTDRITVKEGVSIVPLRLGHQSVGVIYLDRNTDYERDRELLEIFANQVAAAIQNVRLFELATTDATTGTHLRGFAMQRLREVLRTAHRQGAPVSLLMLDIDRLKEINAAHGRLTGDRALHEIGVVLRRSVRATDVVGRYGGDEFVVILPDTPAEGARTVAERIASAAASLRIDTDGPRIPIPIPISLGVGTLEAPVEEHPETISAQGFDAAAKQLTAAVEQALVACRGSRTPGIAAVLTWTGLIPPEHTATRAAG